MRILIHGSWNPSRLEHWEHFQARDDAHDAHHGAVHRGYQAKKGTSNANIVYSAQP